MSGVVVMADAAPARAYQCGKGTPNLSEKKCDCPQGTIESRSERGLSRCVDDASLAKMAAPSSCPADMAAIPGGTYAVGAKAAVVTTTIAPFCMDKTEVTVAAFERCVAAGTCTAPQPYDTAASRKWQAICNFRHPEGRALHPVNCVKWAQATTYCGFVKARLPTEDEWEWAARNASAATDYPWGSTPPAPEKANACGSECPSNMRAKIGEATPTPTLYTTADGFAETSPVGSFPKGDSTAFAGVHDLAGNVAEWTTSRLDSSERIARGGSWRTGDHSLLAMARASFADTAFPAVGFRCVKSSP